MEEFESKKPTRKQYKFYWIGNKGETPFDKNKFPLPWYKYIDIKSWQRLRRIVSKSDPLEVEMVEETNEEPQPLPQILSNPWLSTEYKKLFGLRNNEENIAEVIVDMLEVLQLGHEMKYSKVVFKYLNSTDTKLSRHAKLRIQQKCMYLANLLQKALEASFDKSGIHWNNTCKEVIEQLSVVPQPIPPITNSRVLQKWFASFRKHRKIIVPSVVIDSSNRLPPFLQRYPDLADAINKFADNNIGELSIDLIHGYINKCIEIIVKHDNLFSEIITIDDSDEEESSDEKEGKQVLDSSEEKKDINLVRQLKKYWVRKTRRMLRMQELKF